MPKLSAVSPSGSYPRLFHCSRGLGVQSGGGPPKWHHRGAQCRDAQFYLTLHWPPPADAPSASPMRYPTTAGPHNSLLDVYLGAAVRPPCVSRPSVGPTSGVLTLSTARALSAEHPQAHHHHPSGGTECVTDLPPELRATDQILQRAPTPSPRGPAHTAFRTPGFPRPLWVAGAAAAADDDASPPRKTGSRR